MYIQDSHNSVYSESIKELQKVTNEFECIVHHIVVCVHKVINFVTSTNCPKHGRDLYALTFERSVATYIYAPVLYIQDSTQEPQKGHHAMNLSV